MKVFTWCILKRDRDWWQTLVNTMLNLWFPHKVGNLVIVTFLRRTFLHVLSILKSVSVCQQVTVPKCPDQLC